MGKIHAAAAAILALALATSPLRASAAEAQGVIFFNQGVGPGETFDFNTSQAYVDGDYVVFELTNASGPYNAAFFGDANVEGEFGLGTFDSSNDTVSTTYQVDYFCDECETGSQQASDPIDVAGTFTAVPDTSYHGYNDGGFSYSLLSSAPEPAAWALMLAGVGLAGAALRRRPRLA